MPSLQPTANVPNPKTTIEWSNVTVALSRDMTPVPHSSAWFATKVQLEIAAVAPPLTQTPAPLLAWLRMKPHSKMETEAPDWQESPPPSEGDWFAVKVHPWTTGDASPAQAPPPESSALLLTNTQSIT